MKSRVIEGVSKRQYREFAEDFVEDGTIDYGEISGSQEWSVVAGIDRDSTGVKLTVHEVIGIGAEDALNALETRIRQYE
jgi:hypothetical protein